jgi:hypothetical protein
MTKPRLANRRARLSFRGLSLRTRPLFLTIALLAGLVGAGLYVAPPAFRHWQLYAAADDPVALSGLRLDAALTQGRLSGEIEAALAARDADLADSFAALAQERGLTVTSDQRARLAVLKDGSAMLAVSDFGQGFLSGDRESEAGFAGALAGDIVGFGDLRDLAVEGRKWLGGEAADPTVLAFAAAGLALSAATWVSLGGGLPARNGLSLVKRASRAKLLSPALAASLGRVAVDAVDRPALAAGLAAAARLDIAATRAAAGGIIRPAAMTRLAGLGQDAGALYARGGQRGLRQVLAVAEDAGDLRKAARLAAAKPSTLRATLKVLGRGAFVLGAIGMSALGWLFAALGYALAIAMLAQRFGWWLGRKRLPGREARAWAG